MLVLVRHGQTVANLEGRLQGRRDAPLTDLGRRQAEAVAALVQRADRVVTSPLLRARQTAEAFGVEPEVDDRWIELDYGTLDGSPLRDVSPAMWERWRTDPEFKPPGGEALVDVGARVREACRDITHASAAGDVVVVSHVSPIKVAVAWALGADERATWRMFLDVASVCRIRVAETGPVLVTFNERAHLERLTSG